jgi:hypothetical protein
MSTTTLGPVNISGQSYAIPHRYHYLLINNRNFSQFTIDIKRILGVSGHGKEQ